MIIGLTGTKASGKGEIAKILEQNGFAYSSTSDRVREEAVSKGLVNYTIKDLQDIGNDLREKFGLGVLAKRTLELIKGNENVVIDGIRNLGEIEELKRQGNFVLIAVDASQEKRFERLIARKRESDPKTYSDFLKMDERDLGKEEKNSGQQVGKCIEQADYTLENNETIEELQKKIEEVFGKIQDIAERRKGRISWDEYFMKISALVAERSTCLRHNVGAVIVKGKRIMTTGYNGAASGMACCLELGCLRDELGIASGTRHEICRAIHAEQNAIIQAGIHGINIEGGVMYCTHTPCMICAKMIVNAGIKEFVSYHDYADEDARKFLIEAGVKSRKIDKPSKIIKFKD